MATEHTTSDLVPVGANPVVGVKSVLGIVRRYWWFTAIVALVAVGATFVLTKQQTPRYSASTSVVLRTNETESLFRLRSTTPLELTRSAEVEQIYASSPEFGALARPGSPEGVEVTSRSGSSELVFTARGEDPDAVAAAADHWAAVYLVERQRDVIGDFDDDADFLQGELAQLEAQRSEVRSELDSVEELISSATDAEQLSRLLVRKVALDASLENELAPLEQQLGEFRNELARFGHVQRFLEYDDISAQVVQAATVPTEPISPDLSRNLVVGGLLGLGLGITLPYLRELVSDRLDEKDDVTLAAGLPVLGSIPTFEGDSGGIEVLDDPGSPASEHYQALLTAIEFASLEKPIQSLFITSAVPAEGKTTTTINLAALAAQYLNVLVIDADMRRPTLHLAADIANDRGLADVLAGSVSLEDARVTFERGGTRFDVLPAGPPLMETAILLRSDAWPDLLRRFTAYDLVIIDGPPVLAVTDALLIGRAVDAQLLAVRWASTERRMLTAARDLLATNRTRTLGVVVNRYEAPSSSYDGYYRTYRSVDSTANGEEEPAKPLAEPTRTAHSAESPLTRVSRRRAIAKQRVRR